MKKVFFTVSALVAFSAASMANTIEVKEEVVPVEKKKEVEAAKVELLKRDLCAEIASIRLQQYENNYGCVEDSYANAIWQYYYNRC